MRGSHPSGDRYLADDEREELLRIARRAATTWIREGRLPDESPASEKLKAPGAAFVTLTERGHLRGCIGYTEARAPLYRTVQECAVASATEDPRFVPVSPAEIVRCSGTQFDPDIVTLFLRVQGHIDIPADLVLPEGLDTNIFTSSGGRPA